MVKLYDYKLKDESKSFTLLTKTRVISPSVHWSCWVMMWFITMIHN